MITRRSLLAGLLACPACAGAARAGGAHWSYEGHGGPEEWGALEKDFQACSIGTQQSPINLTGAVRAEASGPALSWKNAPFKVVNNGHTIQLDVAGDAGGAELNGKRYTLRQFHFHAPSEHALNGKRTAMEVHFVHAAEDGGLLVVGVFLVPGEKNEAFATVTAAAPKSEGSAPLPGPFDPSALLPQARGLYRYEGSLTTPPCSEVVDWNVFATPITVAQADIDAFRAIFPMNARPLQAVNRRFLLQLN
ncbi:carbonic anhydrase family protein [Xanthobacter sp. V4C-4]|uniref:carbonic anhydrase n=1 Tax=Xanthobacter cornucopiae TaxID=3119924 RepID=UPI003728D6E0